MNKIKYEIKLMGEAFFIPILVLFMVLIYSILIRNNEYRIELSFSVFQNLIPLFSGWWTIFVISEYLSSPGGDLYFTYGISKTKLGVFKSLKYSIIYTIFTLIILMISMKVLGYNEYSMTVKIILVQSFLFSSISYLIINITKDIGWTIFILIALFVSVYFTRGYILGRFNYYIASYMFLDKDIVSDTSFIAIVESIVFYSSGSFLFNRKQ